MRFSNFHHFIGIDWSGAKNPGRGLQVAQCGPGTKAPQIVANGDRNWRRQEVLEWLMQLHRKGEKIIAGLDFAFAYPYCDEETYFPGHDRTPKDAVSLWGLVDSICRNEDDFYGGPFYKERDTAFSDYLLYMNYKGKYYSNRMRVTDSLCSGNPTSVFKCVGAESVGIGSIAGMRMFNHIKTSLNKNFQIWPFEKGNNGRSVIVEIYPRLFFKLAGQHVPGGWKDLTIVNQVLTHFDSKHLALDTKTIKSKDQIDAIVSAAAIRYLTGNDDTWNPAGLTDCARASEGWIFGAV